MYFIKPASLLALLAVRCAALSSDTNTTLYAWGDGIKGLPVYYGNDGLAYAAENPPSNYSLMTFTVNTSSNTTLTGSFGNQTTAGSFYIIPSGSAYKPAGFVPPNTSSPPTNAMTTGFKIIGSQLLYVSGSQFQSQFWAKLSSVGVWALYWNSDGSARTDAVPVALKTYGPPIQTPTTKTATSKAATTLTTTTQSATTQAATTQTPTNSVYC